MTESMETIPITDTILATLRDIRNAAVLSCKDTLTTEECAMLTGFTEQTIRTYACKRLIPHYKKGGRLVFSKRQIEDWMQSERVNTVDDIESIADSYLRRAGRCKIRMAK